MSGRTLPLALYRLTSHALAPALPLLFRNRLKRGKEDPARIGERFGHASLPRPAGRLIWLHAASVGETMSILPLVPALAEHGTVLLTTGTVTSANLAAQRLPEGAIHQFVPVDLPGPVRRFFDHWQPDLALFCESEIWPNLLLEAHQREIPVGIINGRMSDRSFRRWSRLPSLSRPLLAPLAFLTAQSDADAQRFRAIGAPASSPGNLKFDVPPLPVDEAARAALGAAIGTRPVLLAASTHPGEEEQVIALAKGLASTLPDLLTILVPRHPQRGEAIAALLDREGMAHARRSLGAAPRDDQPFYLADTLGELGLFFSLSTLTLMGGSLVEHGGHNPIEPIKLDCPVISGPHVANFRDIYADLTAARGVVIAPDAKKLQRHVLALLTDSEARAQLASRARLAISRHEGALKRTLEALRPWLEKP
ncbi:MAG: 3-deoxy-D-manno-octulosonic acid transferase [Beijerinckiaceae bacterium]|jgi:3-deoxy-D-manno-octulosonic-acid transferase|nr:3-deoxy-D-manno-octulosonic acid transferase [Beijerinckiaceae bacterium]